MTEKKVVKSKIAFSKSCPKFYKLGDEFFYFDKISKMRILEPKNAFLQGAKEEVKKRHQIKKMTFLKVAQNLHHIEIKHLLKSFISNISKY